MFKSLFFLVGILASVAGVKETEVIRDLKVTSIGAVKPRTEFVTFNTKESALGSRYEQSPYYLSLNGTWDFVYFDDSRDFPQGIETPSYNGEWKSIKVPGNWERQGYGTAIYVNHPYEFKMTRETCPELPEVIPGGVYHRKFSVPANWKGRDLYLNIDGAKAGVFVYVNGKFVGYGEDSKDRAQYKIDEYLNEGVNDLVLKIYRWCTGSYLECQDFWRVSGIERDVYLTSQAPGQMFDYEIVSTLDKDLKTGLLKVNIEGDATYELLDAAGKVIATGSSADKDVKRIAGVTPWSSENPYLYKIVFCSKGEYTAFNVGFRRFEICKIPGDPHGDTQFLVNGQPMIFKGVNIHEHDENTGHYVDEALMRKDFELMKANNLNAFRTCHYPQPRRFYELADEYGIYVYCEANIESHGMGYGEASLAHRADFYDSHLSRTVNMYERCKNYPCVTIWSLGNEAGNGENFVKTYSFIKGREKCDFTSDMALQMNRPVVYERALSEENTDMHVPQYPSSAWFKRQGENGADMHRPEMPSEYAHAMGNSTGRLARQWEYIYKYPNLQGGFIWDWVDQGFAETDSTGRKYWTYGGDYGVNMPSDRNFNCNGIVNPDRNPHPAMAEVKYAYSYIAVEAVNLKAGCFRIFNRNFFTSLDSKRYQILYSIEEEGVITQKGIVKYPVTAPQQGSEFVVDAVAKCKMKSNLHYYIRFDVTDLKGSLGLPAKSVVASEQFFLGGPEQNPIPSVKSSKEVFKVREASGEYAIFTPNCHVVVSTADGMLKSFRYNKKEMFEGGFGIVPNFWRPLTDNDNGNGGDKRMAVWKDAVQNAKVKVTYDLSEPGQAVIKVDYELPTGNALTVTYTATASGVLHTRLDFKGTDQKAPEIPRIGIRFHLPKSSDSFSYYGRGPEENYCDRACGTFVGLYSSKAAAEYYPYVRPQETGHHVDTYWMEFKDIKVIADSRMEFNVLRQAVEDLDLGQQKHVNDVAFRDFVEVCLDYRQQGVGGYDSWGARPEPEDQISAADSCSWGFTIVPR